MNAVDFIRSQALALPPLTKFALGMAVVFGVPVLSRRVRLPAAVGLLLSGVVLGPHVLDVFGTQRPVADFFADLGKLLLMFFAGLEVDLALFRQVQRKAITFGVITTTIPLVLGTAVGLLFGYPMVTAVVMGSLLASHTLLGIPMVMKIGANRLEPFIVTVGATVLSDTLSLVVFAMCVSTFQHGFSVSGLALQLVEIVVFVPLLLISVGRGGGYLLKKAEDDEAAYFVLMLGIMAAAVALTRVVDLPGIVGAFLAGLAVNSAVQEKPAKEKLEFMGNALFIPMFLIVTGFLIDPIAFARSIADHFALAASVVGALIIGKGVAAAIAARAFKYTRAAMMTVWSLTLPQLAATLAATLVGFDTLNSAGQRLIDETVLDVVFVLILVTGTIGPMMTQRYAPLMLASSRGTERDKAA
jgi:Kef-type K+ transport system membrane component KefB